MGHSRRKKQRPGTYRQSRQHIGTQGHQGLGTDRERLHLSLVKAVVYAGYGAVPVLTQVADPDCPADGVVVAVGATGVCRSDWHAWKGHDPVTLPHIGGHEFAGVVVAAGPG